MTRKHRYVFERVEECRPLKEGEFHWIKGNLVRARHDWSSRAQGVMPFVMAEPADAEGVCDHAGARLVTHPLEQVHWHCPKCGKDYVLKLKDAEGEKVTMKGLSAQAAIFAIAEFAKEKCRDLNICEDTLHGKPTPQPEALKPCPMCGCSTVGYSKETNDDLGGWNYVFMCDNDNCPFHFYLWDQDGAVSVFDAYTLWNRRA